MSEPDKEIRDRIHRIMWTSEMMTVATDLLVEMVKEEKSKSYGLGYQDGQRKDKQRG